MRHIVHIHILRDSEKQPQCAIWIWWAVIVFASLLGLEGHAAPMREPVLNRIAVVSLVDGSRIVGRIPVARIPCVSSNIGKVDIAVNALRAIWFPGGGSNQIVRMMDGDLVKAWLLFTNIHIESVVGSLNLHLEHIRQIKFLTPRENLCRDLVARWSGEDNARDVMEKHDGEAKYGVEYVQGKVGNAFSFGKNRAYIRIRDEDGFRFKGSFSLEGWIFVDGQAERDPESVICMRGGNRGGNGSWSLKVSSDKLIIGTVRSTAAEATIKSSIPFKEWTHVAMVLDREKKQLNLYVNGGKVASIETDLLPDRHIEEGEDVAIGLGNHPGETQILPFRGLMDEWGVYSRALSEEEIRQVIEAAQQNERIMPLEKRVDAVTRAT